MIDRKKSIERIFGRKFSLATRVQLLWKGKDSFKSILMPFGAQKNSSVFNSTFSEMTRPERRYPTY